MSHGSYFNLETDNSHSHPIITEGDGDFNIQEGHGDVQMKHGGDIVESNMRGSSSSPTPRRHFHIDTDKLRGLTSKPKKKKSKKSKKKKKNHNSRKYRNVPRWEEEDYYFDNEDFYDDYDYQSNFSDEEYYP